MATKTLTSFEQLGDLRNSKSAVEAETSRKSAIDAFWKVEAGHGNFTDWTEKKADNLEVWRGRKEYERKMEYRHAADFKDDPRVAYITGTCDNINLSDEMFCEICLGYHASWNLKKGWVAKWRDPQKFDKGAVGVNLINQPVNQFPRKNDGFEMNSDHASHGGLTDGEIYGEPEPRHCAGTVTQALSKLEQKRNRIKAKQAAEREANRKRIMQITANL